MKLKLPKISKLSDIKLPTLPVDLREVESFDKEHYRLIAYGLGAVMALMIVAGVAAFILSLRGAEQTMVPDVRGMELSQALIKMQEKELYPRLSLRYTDDPLQAGTIVDQSPAAGTIVKAGRRIALTVSRGAVVKKVENFVGQDLGEVKIHLQSLFAGQRPLLNIKDVSYISDKAPAGTILEQKPLQDTELAGPTDLFLIVSQGPQKAQILVPDLTGLSIDDVLLQVAKNDLVVNFSMRDPARGEKPGTVVSETPTPGSTIAGSARVSVTIAAPLPEKGYVAGIFTRSLPDYPYPLKVSLEAVGSSGMKTPLLTVNHPGASFTAPYFLPEGSKLELSVLGKAVPPDEDVVSSKAP